MPKALDLVEESLKKYWTFYKLWLIKAHILLALGRFEDARKVYDESLTIDEVKSERTVWLNYA